MILSAVNWNWWLRWVEYRVITEDGMFAAALDSNKQIVTEVPDDYGGAELTVKIIQRLIMCTQSGHFQQLDVGDADLEVMDKERKKGLGLIVKQFDPKAEDVTTAPTGPSAKSVTWYVEENLSMTADLRIFIKASYEVAKFHLEQ